MILHAYMEPREGMNNRNNAGSTRSHDVYNTVYCTTHERIKKKKKKTEWKIISENKRQTHSARKQIKGILNNRRSRVGNKKKTNRRIENKHGRRLTTSYRSPRVTLTIDTFLIGP